MLMEKICNQYLSLNRNKKLSKSKYTLQSMSITFMKTETKEAFFHVRELSSFGNTKKLLVEVRGGKGGSSIISEGIVVFCC